MIGTVIRARAATVGCYVRITLPHPSHTYGDSRWAIWEPSAIYQWFLASIKTDCPTPICISPIRNLQLRIGSGKAKDEPVKLFENMLEIMRMESVVRGGRKQHILVDNESLYSCRLPHVPSLWKRSMICQRSEGRKKVATGLRERWENRLTRFWGASDRPTVFLFPASIPTRY